MESRIRLRLQNAGLNSTLASEYATKLVQEGCNTFQLMAMLTKTDLSEFGIRKEHLPQVEFAVNKVKALGQPQQQAMSSGIQLPLTSVSPAILTEKIGDAGVPDKLAEEIANKLFFELGYQNVRQFKQLTEAVIRDKFVLDEDAIQAIMSLVSAANIDPTKPPDLKSSKIDAHGSAILSIAAISGEGNGSNTILYSVSADCMLKTWIIDHSTTTFPSSPVASYPHGGCIWDVAVSSGMVATACGDGTLHLFSHNSNTAAMLNPMGILSLPEGLTPKTDSIWAVCISPDSTRVACGSKLGVIALFDVANSGGGAAPLKTYIAHRGNSIWRMKYHPTHTSLIASSSFDGSLSVWNTDAAPGTPSSALLLSGHKGPVRGFCYTPDTKYIITGSDDGILRVWNVSTSKCIDQHQYAHENSTINSVAMVSPDMICTGGGGGSIKLWTFKKGKEDIALSVFRTIHSGHVGGIWGIVPIVVGHGNGNGNNNNNKIEFLTCSTDRELRLWSIKSMV
jgi:WD40 repeat protein